MGRSRHSPSEASLQGTEQQADVMHVIWQKEEPSQDSNSARGRDMPAESTGTRPRPRYEHR